ncbi:MAG: DUF4169 family protein [Paracoccaceae bacterium]
MSVVNLNKARKAKARADKRAQADQNSIRFGRSKSQKSADEKRAETAARHIDGHKRDT